MKLIIVPVSVCTFEIKNHQTSKQNKRGNYLGSRIQCYVHRARRGTDVAVNETH